MIDEKLQKVLARSGLGSRREMERWIEAGRIQVNGQTATLGDRISVRDEVEVDGRPEKMIFDRDSERRVLVYNKPLGEVSTRHDPEGRSTVFDHLPPLKQGRWIAVGRLDINTSGLLLFTTDGELANNLMHPSANIDREYAVRILGDVDDAMIERLKKGVLLDDGMARFTDVQFFDGDGANKWYHVCVMEGRNREVRRLWESQGVQVSRLKRVRYGPFFMPSEVKAGQWKELSQKEINMLSNMLGMKQKHNKAPTPKEKEIAEKRAKKQKVRRQVGPKRGE